MSEPLTGSWRKAFDYKFLSAEDFDEGQEVTMTISKVTHEEAYDHELKKTRSDVMSLNFEETKKFLWLKPVHAREIKRAAGSKDFEKWTGVKIVLYTKKGKWFGQEQYAIRVKPVAG